MIPLIEILDYLEKFAPLSLAGDWDNVGLLLGDRSQKITKVMTCLTVTREVVQEALETSADLIVTHHPILFRGAKRITTESAEGRAILSLARAGVAVYSPHTAFDNTSGGINDLIGEILGLEELVPLRATPPLSECKIAVFVSEADLSRVSEALFAAGAGNIGRYSQCSFRSPGTGTFFGSKQTKPTIGEKNRREQVSEWRLEVVCPENRVSRVIASLRAAHSYEEPAFDVYPLKPTSGGKGEGRIGRLPLPINVQELALTVKKGLRVPGVQVVGDQGRVIRSIAIVCGAGGDFIKDAIRSGVDAFLTGELRFHDTLAAQAHDLALILPGHFASERFAMETLARKLKIQWPLLVVWASKRDEDPVRWI